MHQAGADAFRARSLAALQPPHNAKTGRCGDPDTRGLRDDAFYLSEHTRSKSSKYLPLNAHDPFGENCDPELGQRARRCG
jgi:hypothetical protein